MTPAAKPTHGDIYERLGEILSRLDTLDGALIARMSGSGATCFALFADDAAAAAAAQQMTRDQPEWWVAAGRLL